MKLFFKHWKTEKQKAYALRLRASLVLLIIAAETNSSIVCAAPPPPRHLLPIAPQMMVTSLAGSLSTRFPG